MNRRDKEDEKGGEVVWEGVVGGQHFPPNVSR